MSQPEQQSMPVTQMIYEKAPSTRQTVKFLTATTMGAALLLLSGLALTGTVIGLIVATPVLVIFSPILVPAAITVFLVMSGFLFSGGSGVAAITVFSWIYSYMTGQQPPGAGPVDYARSKIAGTTRDMTERAKEYGQFAQQKAQEATRPSS